jgi:hypothetical protein
MVHGGVMNAQVVDQMSHDDDEDGKIDECQRSNYIAERRCREVLGGC